MITKGDLYFSMGVVLRGGKRKILVYQGGKLGFSIGSLDDFLSWGNEKIMCDKETLNLLNSNEVWEIYSFDSKKDLIKWEQGGDVESKKTLKKSEYLGYEMWTGERCMVSSFEEENKWIIFSPQNLSCKMILHRRPLTVHTFPSLEDLIEWSTECQ